MHNDPNPTTNHSESATGPTPRSEARVYTVELGIEVPGQAEEAVHEFASVAAMSAEDPTADGFETTHNVAGYGRYDAVRRAYDLARALLGAGAFDSHTVTPLSVTDQDGDTLRFTSDGETTSNYQTPEQVPTDLGALVDALVEKTIGYGLDNGHDMADTDPEAHLANDWPGYVEVALEELEDLTHGEDHPVVEEYGIGTLRDLLYQRLPSEVAAQVPDGVSVADPRNVR
ncbi:MAG: hypothetical protein ACI9CA_000442 [Natronomonas sp.]|jgi:hypothetical protein